MLNIRKHYRIHQKHRIPNMRNDIGKIEVNAEREKSKFIRKTESGDIFEYLLVCKIATRFASADDELDSRTEQALNELQHEFYKDIIGKLYEIRGSVNARDTNESLQRIHDLLDFIRVRT